MYLFVYNLFLFFSDIEFAVDETEEVGETIYNKIGMNILWDRKKIFWLGLILKNTLLF